jgi:stress-induced morphogen
MCNHLQGDEITQMMCVIEEHVQKALPGAQVEVGDPTGTGHHFEIQVTSKDFEGLSLVQQHKMVNGALKELMADTLHAVIIKTKIK